MLIFLASLGVARSDSLSLPGSDRVLHGPGMVINGLAFTVPRKTLADRSDEAKSQRELEAKIQNATPNQLASGSQPTNDLLSRDIELPVVHR